MLVEILSPKVLSVLFIVFILLATIDLVKFANAGIKWLTKMVNDFKKSRKAKKQVIITHDRDDTEWQFDPNASMPEQLKYLLNYWFVKADSAFKFYPTALFGGYSPVVECIKISEGHGAGFDYENRWMCRFSPLTFANYDLLDLVSFLRAYVHVEYLHSDHDGVEIFFRHSTSNERILYPKVELAPFQFHGKVPPLKCSVENEHNLISAGFMLPVPGKKNVSTRHIFEIDRTFSTDEKIKNALSFWIGAIRSSKNDGSVSLDSFVWRLEQSANDSANNWFCELDRLVFSSVNLLHLITFIHQIVPVIRVCVSGNDAGNVLIYFDTTDEPAH